MQDLRELDLDPNESVRSVPDRAFIRSQLFLPIFYLADGGLGSITNSQGASMTTNGAPNDLLGSWNPLTIVCRLLLKRKVKRELLTPYPRYRLSCRPSSTTSSTLTFARRRFPLVPSLAS